jgi:hypothetical protein
VVALCYAGTLRNGFVWDDRLTALAPPSWETLVGSRTGAYYRPVVRLSFAADRSLWGEAAAGYHLTNILCHAAVSWLLLLLGRAVGLGGGAALAGALVFAAHPVQTEAVSYISGRTDLLCALFLLCALHLWRRARSAWDRHAVTAGAAIVLALLCKEAAVLAPLALLLPSASAVRPAPLPLVPLSCALAWLLAWSTSAGGPGVHVTGLVQRLPAVAAAGVTYLRLLVWPADLHLERFTPVEGWSGGMVAVFAGILAATGAALLAAARRLPGGWLWRALAVTTYAPVSGLLPVYPQVADRVLFTPEHFLSLPLLGIGPLVTGAIAVHWPRRARAVAAPAFALLLVVWGAVIVDRNADWRDEETLFRHTLAYQPPVARVWFNLGNTRLAAGDFRRAADLYAAALARSPNDAAIHYNLGIALQKQHRLAEAESHYARALALDPSQRDAARALAALHAAALPAPVVPQRP